MDRSSWPIIYYVIEIYIYWRISDNKVQFYTVLLLQLKITTDHTTFNELLSHKSINLCTSYCTK